jgi:hypothetical protein
MTTEVRRHTGMVTGACCLREQRRRCPFFLSILNLIPCLCKCECFPGLSLCIHVTATSSSLCGAGGFPCGRTRPVHAQLRACAGLQGPIRHQAPAHERIRENCHLASEDPGNSTINASPYQGRHVVVMPLELSPPPPPCDARSLQCPRACRGE